MERRTGGRTEVRVTTQKKNFRKFINGESCQPIKPETVNYKNQLRERKSKIFTGQLFENYYFFFY